MVKTWKTEKTSSKDKGSESSQKVIGKYNLEHIFTVYKLPYSEEYILRSVAFLVTEYNEVLLCYQQGQVVIYLTPV